MKCGLCGGYGYRWILWMDGINFRPCCDCNPDGDPNGGAAIRDSLDKALSALALTVIEPVTNDQKEGVAGWLTLAERLGRLEEPFRSKNVAMCLASAYRQGKRQPTMQQAIELLEGKLDEASSYYGSGLRLAITELRLALEKL